MWLSDNHPTHNKGGNNTAQCHHTDKTTRDTCHQAIQKKGNVDFLKDVTPTSLSSDSKDSIIVTDTKDNTSSLKEELRTKKKSLDNWGRPRKQLIEGVKEVSLTVQLPETLIKALRKEGKKQGKSMKELIGTSLLSTYSSLLQ